MEHKERDEEQIIDYETEERPEEVSGDVDTRPQRVLDANQKLNADLNRYNAEEFIGPNSEVDDEKKFDRVISSNTFKQWIFIILTALIIILAILDIFFGIGKLDKWVYLFGVVTAYEANEAREKKVITKEYKETRQRTRNIIKSVLLFQNRVN